MDRKLASIQRIKSIESIENADAIEKVTVLGWHCVAKKGEFKPSDLCVYIEVDSVLPQTDWTEFLKQRGYRIKTIKLRGQVSQGICFPLSIVPKSGVIEDGLVRTSLEEGDDVTDVLGVIKWEPQLPVHLTKSVHGLLPQYFPRTDETRIQSVPDVLKRNAGVQCYVTEKVDGTSLSIWKKGEEFGVGSRHYNLKDEEGNKYWEVIKKLQVFESLNSNHIDNIALQGELLGPGIQKNKYQLKDYIVRWFNAYSIESQKYYSMTHFFNLLDMLNLESVPIVGNIVLGALDVDGLVELSKGKSQLISTVNREGIVVRPYDETQDEDLGRLSFKVINPDFLLKYDE